MYNVSINYLNRLEHEPSADDSHDRGKTNPKIIVQEFQVLSDRYVVERKKKTKKLKKKILLRLFLLGDYRAHLTY